MRLAQPAAFAALAFVVAGCATHEVRVDSLARPNVQPASYVLRVSSAVAEADSLRARELVGQVRSALAGRGLYEAAPNVTPDVIVEIDCGVSPAQMKPKRIPGALGSTRPLMEPNDVEVGTDEEGKPLYRKAQLVQTPAGYFEMVPTYEKYLRVTAHANTPTVEGHPAMEIWRIDATTESGTYDLRPSLPVLVAASIDHLGQDSHGQKTVHVKETDANVAATKRGL